MLSVLQKAHVLCILKGDKSGPRSQPATAKKKVSDPEKETRKWAFFEKRALSHEIRERRKT